MEKQDNDDNINLKEKIKNLEIENQKLNQNNQKLEKKVKRLEDLRGTNKKLSFEINNEEEWNDIENKLHKTGILLEYEILDHIKETKLKFKANNSFIYPSDQGVFYIDYFFDKWDSVTPTFNLAELETDLKVFEEVDVKDENFKINVKIIYFIECKSRIPPINYIIIPDNTLTKAYKAEFVFNGSNILNRISIESDFFIKTKQKIIGIKYPHLNIDRQKIFNKAFWQLFRSIDYESNYYNLYEAKTSKFLNRSFFNKLDIPDKEIEDLEFPQDLKDIQRIYNDWQKVDKIPKKLKESIYLNLELYVPIIIVNGNIYSIDLAKGKDISIYDKQKRIPCFIKSFNYLMGSTEVPFKYNSLNDFFMMQLFPHLISSKRLAHNFYYSKLNPDLDIIVVSSNQFSEVFKKLRDTIKKSLREFIQDKMKYDYLERKDELLQLQVFNYMLLNNEALEWDFIGECYKSYMDSLNKKRRLFKRIK